MFIVRCLFSVLRKPENGICFSRKDFKGKGGFLSYWKRKFAVCISLDPLFGSKPNKRVMDPEAQFKLRNCADPPLDIDNSYDDCRDVFIFSACTGYYLRCGDVSVVMFILFYFLYLFTQLF